MPYLGKYIIIICTNDAYEFIIDMFDSVKAMADKLNRTMDDVRNSLWKIRHGGCSCILYCNRKVKLELIDARCMSDDEVIDHEVC